MENKKIYLHNNDVKIDVRGGNSYLLENGCSFDAGHRIDSINITYPGEDLISFYINHPNPDTSSDDLLISHFNLDLAQTSALIGALKFFKKNLEKSIKV